MDKLINSITSQLKEMKKSFDRSGDLKQLEKNVSDFSKKYKNHLGIGDLLINLGEDFYKTGQIEAGQIFMLTIDKYFEDVFDVTTLFLRCGEYYIENGETEKGTEYLINLCEGIGNYEESIALRELTDVWNRYKNYVEGKVEKSIVVNDEAESALPSPESCSMKIEDILPLPDDRLLIEISTHLYELSLEGEFPEDLNKWERTVFLADEFWQEVNSGGIYGYLYSYGYNWEQMCDAFKRLKTDKTLAILTDIKNKFPDCKVPAGLAALQVFLDENEPDFDEEDNRFYEFCQKEIEEKLLSFIRKNEIHFR